MKIHIQTVTFFYRKFVETDRENRTFILLWLSHNCRRNLSLEENNLMNKERKTALWITEINDALAES